MGIRTIEQWLKPTAAGSVLLAVLLAVQSMLMVGQGTATSTVLMVGVPTWLTITSTTSTDGLSRDTAIGFNVVAIVGVLLVSYLLAMPLGRLVSPRGDGADQPTGWRHPAAILLIVVLVILLVSAVLTSIAPITGHTGSEMNPTLFSFLSYTLLGLFFTIPVAILALIVRARRGR